MILATILAIAPLAASAQTTPWGDAGGCARTLNREFTTDLVFILWPDRIERHESTCSIVGIEGDVNTRAVIDTLCNGEGETWTQSYGMTFVGNDTIAIWPVDAPEFTFELRPCE